MSEPDRSVYPDPEYVARWAGRVLDVTDILTVLPHRPPMLLVDRVVELQPGERGVGLKGVTIGEYCFQGHFPGHPVMPGVLIVEALAQVVGVVIMTGFDRGEMLAYFTGIDEAKFRRPVRPGDLLRLEVEIERARYLQGKLMARAQMTARVDDEMVASARGAFAMVDPNSK